MQPLASPHFPTFLSRPLRARRAASPPPLGLARRAPLAWGAAGVCCLLGFTSPARADAPMARNPGTFVWGTIGEPTSLDPAASYDAVSQGIAFNVYDTLLAFEGETNDRIVPRLATRVPSLKNGLISIDGLTYAFPIRRGVGFHDGSTLTPHDVRYSLLRFMLADPAGGPASLLLEPILGVGGTRDVAGRLQVRFEDADRAVRVEGDKVIVRLKRPFGPFLSILARWSYVMSREWARRNGEWDGEAATWKRYNGRRKEDSCFHERMNGTGPFQFERWDRQGRRLHLKRFDRYWGKRARLERVVVASVPEFSTRKLMLQAGDADLIESPRPLLSQLQGLPGVRVADGLPRLMTDPVLFFTFQINSEANPDIGSGKLDGNGIPPDFFSDKDLRKAFAHSFDYEAFLRDTLKGAGTRALGPVPPQLPGHDPRGAVYDMDLAKAGFYFRKAWGGKVWERGFKFTATYNSGSETREAPCRILKKNVESLNDRFRIDVRGVEWPSFLDKAQKRKMPLFSRGWTADYPDAHNFVFPFYHSQGRYASAQAFSDVRIDRMIEGALRELDPKKRERLYWEIQRRGHEEIPHILTAHPVGAYGLREWVRGFYDNAVFMGIYCHPLSK